MKSVQRCLLALFVVAFVVATAAGCAGLNVLDDSSRVDRGSLPEYFEQIPADTVYFAGGSQPTPAAVIGRVRSMIERLGMRAHGEAGSGALGPAGALLEALGEEVGDGDRTQDELGALGFASNPRFAVYTVGLAPVVRLEVDDADRVRETVERLAGERGFEGAEREYDERTYRRYTAPEADRDLLVRVADSELVFAAVDPAALGDFAPYLVGAVEPQESMRDENTFGRIAEAHGFEPYGVAYLDVRRLVDTVRGDERAAGVPSSLSDPTSNGFAELRGDGACLDDYGRLAERAPRLVGGVRAYGDEAVEVAAGAELDDRLTERLDDVGGSAPGRRSEIADGALVGLEVGVEVEALFSALGDEARRVRDEPFRCEPLEAWNARAEAVVQTIDVAPMAVRDLAGASLYLRELLLEWRAEPAEALIVPRAVAAFRTDEARGLLALLGQLIPGVDRLAGQVDRGEPVSARPLSGLYPGLIDPTLYVDERGLAVGVGPRMDGAGEALLETDDDGDGPAVSARLDVREGADGLADDLRTVLDRAERDRYDDEAADDIAAARRAVDRLEERLSGAQWTARLAVELDERAALVSYRRDGDVDNSMLEWAEWFEGRGSAHLGVLWRVLVEGNAGR